MAGLGRAYRLPLLGLLLVALAGCGEEARYVSTGPGPDEGSAGSISGGSAGAMGSAGSMASAGAMGSAGSMASGGSAGAAGAGGEGGDEVHPEPGRLAGITAAHNAVRARQSNPVPVPPLAPLVWSDEVATVAQAYADELAASGCRLEHSGLKGYGENLAWYSGQMPTAEEVVEGWAGEEACYVFGNFMTTDSCDLACAAAMFANGCGHYTQIVWRNTSEVGCGVAQCPGTPPREIWSCSYKGPGNYIGQKPY